VINIYITKLTWDNLAHQETYEVLNLLGRSVPARRPPGGRRGGRPLALSDFGDRQLVINQRSGSN
jgi:hypothetical protein